MRIAVCVEYDGSQFHGWQVQTGLRTVQGVLEAAISQVAGHPIRIYCAGRTDTGVHATYQVAHFDTSVVRNTRAWIHGVNSHLPKDVTVRSAKQVDSQFHARFNATGRHYRYLIFNHPIRPSLYQRHLTWQYRPLDVAAMQQASQLLIGKHDFTSFRSIDCQAKTAERDIKVFNVKRQGNLIVIDVIANAFLHHMVRNLAGVLIAIGSGKQEVMWALEVLEERDRTKGAETAPAYGLYLVDVHYPEVFNVPKSDIGPVFFV